MKIDLYRRTSLGFLKNGFGSKPRTCPPILQSYVVVSNASICVNAADAVLEIGPERFHVVADRRENAQTSDNYSALGHDGDESLKREALKG